jgi:hypothetical protein
LLKDSALAPFDLAKAATLAPKDEGALNIESLAADAGKLWIGFRNLQSKAKDALLVPLLNPTEIINKSARAKLGDPLLLKLGGLGVRDMVAWNYGFLSYRGKISTVGTEMAESVGTTLSRAPGCRQNRFFSAGRLSGRSSRL